MHDSCSLSGGGSPSASHGLTPCILVLTIYPRGWSGYIDRCNSELITLWQQLGFGAIFLWVQRQNGASTWNACETLLTPRLRIYDNGKIWANCQSLPHDPTGKTFHEDSTWRTKFLLHCISQNLNVSPFSFGHCSLISSHDHVLATWPCAF